MSAVLEVWWADDQYGKGVGPYPGVGEVEPRLPGLVVPLAAIALFLGAAWILSAASDGEADALDDGSELDDEVDPKLDAGRVGGERA